MCHVPFLFLWSSLADSQWCHEEINCFCWKQGFIIIQKGGKKETKWRSNKSFCFFYVLFLGTDWMKLHSQFASAFSSCFCCPSITFFSLLIFTSNHSPAFCHSFSLSLSPSRPSFFFDNLNFGLLLLRCRNIHLRWPCSVIPGCNIMPAHNRSPNRLRKRLDFVI